MRAPLIRPSSIAGGSIDFRDKKIARLEALSKSQGVQIEALKACIDTLSKRMDEVEAVRPTLKLKTA